MPTLDLPALLGRRRLFVRYVQRRVNDPAVAEDIVQTAYMRALERAKGTDADEPASSEAWFYTVLRNAVIDHYRRRSSESSAMERWKNEFGDAEPAAPAPEPDRFVCGCIERVLPNLRPAYAELLRAVELGGQPLQEFAQSHQLSAGNAGVRAHRARAALRTALVEFCGSCSISACLDCICKNDPLEPGPCTP